MLFLRQSDFDVDIVVEAKSDCLRFLPGMGVPGPEFGVLRPDSEKPAVLLPDLEKPAKLFVSSSNI